MSIPIGPSSFEHGEPAPFSLTPPPSGTGGARSNKTTASDTGVMDSEADELKGKFGPVVGVYDPEGTDRLIQEF